MHPARNFPPNAGPRLARSLAAALALLVALCGAHAAGPLRIGIGLVKPPYVMAPDAGLPGLEVEITEQALAAAGYLIQAEQLPPARALALLRAGRLDGMLSVDVGIGGTDHFSEPYIHYQNVAVTLASRAIALRGVDDLLQYSVAAFQNAHLILGEDFRAMAARHRNYREHPQQVTQNRLLYSGRVDVVIGDRLIFRYLNQELDKPLSTQQKVVYHGLFPPSPRLAVFRDAQVRDAFNAGLRTLRRNGGYAALMKKYQAYLAP